MLIKETRDVAEALRAARTAVELLEALPPSPTDDQVRAPRRALWRAYKELI